MGSKTLSGKKVAVLVADGFEQSEFTRPVEALKQAGATVHVVSPSDGKVKGWDEDDWGDQFEVDVPLADARSKDYDALVLPGGVLNPDTLRQEKKAVVFTQDFFAQRKPVAAICHGPQLLIEADVVRGRELTSYQSVKIDLLNAGARWVDREVVVDNGLVTSRKPSDLDAFCEKMIEEIAEGRHA